MPITFDFRNDGTADEGGISLGMDATVVNEADGVRFTISSDSSSDARVIIFNNQPEAGAIQLSDSGDGNNIFTLGFQSIANTAFTRITGTVNNPIQLDLGFVGAGWEVDFRTTGGGFIGDQTFTMSVPSATASVVADNVTGVRFTSASGGFDQLIINTLTAEDLNCFCAGTRIATPEGFKPVEDLQAGDHILTAEGGKTEVKWLGKSHVDTDLSHPRMVNPVRICAGALGRGLPERDLWISQDHAVGLEGFLINACALINGQTIFQEPEMPRNGFTYYHVETSAHELILAEGLAVESFVDYRGRAFDNAQARQCDAVITEMDRPRISSARLLPNSIRRRVRPDRAA